MTSEGQEVVNRPNVFLFSSPKHPKQALCPPPPVSALSLSSALGSVHPPHHLANPSLLRAATIFLISSPASAHASRSCYPCFHPCGAGIAHTCLLSWRRQWHPTPVLLSGKFHGRRSLVGCSPWGREESDVTEWLHFHFPLSCTGEGNGNPLQCSCLENPRNGGAWWAAVYGVAQSWTWLEQLSSSNSNESWTIKKTEHWRSDTFK